MLQKNFKRLISLLLCGILLCTFACGVGCVSKSKRQQSPTNVFTLPRLKKEEPKSGKVKKDPDVPVTMGEAMMGERVSIL